VGKGSWGKGGEGTFLSAEPVFSSDGGDLHSSTVSWAGRIRRCSGIASPCFSSSSATNCDGSAATTSSPVQRSRRRVCTCVMPARRVRGFARRRVLATRVLSMRALAAAADATSAAARRRSRAPVTLASCAAICKAEPLVFASVLRATRELKLYAMASMRTV